VGKYRATPKVAPIQATLSIGEQLYFIAIRIYITILISIIVSDKCGALTKNRNVYRVYEMRVGRKGKRDRPGVHKT